MVATNQDIRNFYALTGNNDPVTDSQFLVMRDWLAYTLRKDTVDANDYVNWVYNMTRQEVTNYKRRTADMDWT